MSSTSLVEMKQTPCSSFHNGCSQQLFSSCCFFFTICWIYKMTVNGEKCSSVSQRPKSLLQMLFCSTDNPKHKVKGVSSWHLTLTINVADKYTFSQLSSCPIDFLSSAFNSLDPFFCEPCPSFGSKRKCWNRDTTCETVSKVNSWRNVCRAATINWLVAIYYINRQLFL